MATKKKTEVISETEMRQAELNTKKIIAGMPKVWVIIAPDEKDPMWRGCINGVDYKFPKGEMIEVPEPVADLIRHSSRMQELKKQHEEALVKTINMGSMG